MMTGAIIETPAPRIKTVATTAAVLGVVLSHLRKQKGMNQKELASKMQLSESTWSRIEKGTSGLSIDQLRQVSKVFSVKPGDILELHDRWIGEAVRQGVSVIEGNSDSQFERIANGNFDLSSIFIHGDQLLQILDDTSM
jgi:transcriptional regulator with XRE-family HTH domain